MKHGENVIHNEFGGVSIEAGFYFLIYALISALFIDFSIAFITKSKSDRVSASAVSILRERTHFYSGNADVTSKDAESLYKIVKNMLGTHNVAVSIAYAKIDDSGFFLTKKHDFNIMKDCTDISTNELSEKMFNNLSPVIMKSDGTKKQYPLYQVRICQPGNESMFKKMISSESDKLVVKGNISKNIAIYR